MGGFMNTQLKLKFYYDHVLSQVYREGDSPYHDAITKDVIEKFIDPLGLAKNSNIIDLGCGPGYFLREMTVRGYKNLLGLTFSQGDIDHCVAQGHRVERRDMNFLSEADESVHFLFSRHSLEHSPFPYITLLEYNRVLRPGGYIYIEVPQPDCEREHEKNLNHYSILGRNMWLNLFRRTGFDCSWYDYEIPISFPDERGTVTEKFYIFVCKKRCSVDVK